MRKCLFEKMYILQFQSCLWQNSVFRFHLSVFTFITCANCDFCENIAWVFWVNRVFGVFLIYPKYPKYYLFFFFSSQTANPHNRFFFIRLCGFALLPNNLITSILRTFCKGLSSLIYSVRGSRCSGIICVLIQGDIRRGGGYLRWIDFDCRTYGAWHSRL